MAGRQKMSLALEFADGKVTGSGSDRIGDFDMAGTYELKTGVVAIDKTYHRAHLVIYEGRNDGDGLWIWGVWRMTDDRGGFHMWPAGEDDPTGRNLKAEEPARHEQERARVRPEPALLP
jgi:hypothetical protein